MNTLLKSLFPNLRDGNFQITSSDSEKYNCIAWAAKDEGNWWWPRSSDMSFLFEKKSYWPISGVNEITINSFILAFNTLDYVQCNNSELENHIEKVAIYVDNNDEPTHMARQLESGRWTSKLGDNVDIEHHTLEALEGSIYGKVAVILKRPRANQANHNDT